MSAKDTGGPAFPVPSGCRFDLGMTLRDWFAGQALGGKLANKYVDGTPQEISQRCYAYADAMLKERAK